MRGATGPGTVDVRVEATIERPVAQAATFAADPDNAPRWYANIHSAEWRTPPPLQVGSRMDFVVRFLGRRLAYTDEVIAWELDARLVMRTADGPFPMETAYTWEAAPDGTRMTLQNRGRPGGFLRLTARLMEAAMRRATQQDLARLKEWMEAAAR